MLHFQETAELCPRGRHGFPFRLAGGGIRLLYVLPTRSSVCDFSVAVPVQMRCHLIVGLICIFEWACLLLYLFIG